MGQKTKFVSTNFFESEKIFGSAEKGWVRKNFRSEIIVGSEKSFGSLKIFGSEKNLSYEKNLGSEKKFGPKKIFGLKIVLYPKQNVCKKKI